MNLLHRDAVRIFTMLKNHHRAAMAVLLALTLTSVRAATNTAETPAWLSQPLSLDEAVRVALAQNGSILRSQHDLEAAHGVAIQTRAIVLPKITGAASFEHNDAVERDRFSRQPGFLPLRNEWSGSIRVSQNIFEGGKLVASWRAARLVKEQAFQEYQTIIAAVLLDVRTSYYDVLLAEQQIAVREASVKLLEQELTNTTRRAEAGAVPRFDVLRGEVELANARPKLIRARNTHRTAKNALVTLLGYNLPTNVLYDIPLTLTSKLDTEPYNIALSDALAQARERRPELNLLRTDVELQRERVAIARSGFLPALGVFAGYKSYNSEYRDDFYSDISGAVAGVEMKWDIFDGLATRGRLVEARARQSRASVNLDEHLRRVDQEVRTFYSSFIEAREVLESQAKNIERAEEAIRLAVSRYDAGSSTQLDVLNAQTALTDARTTQIDAARDYLVARARLERAIGLDVARQQSSAPTKVEVWKPTP
jgi:outer membrane protein